MTRSSEPCRGRILVYRAAHVPDGLLEGLRKRGFVADRCSDDADVESTVRSGTFGVVVTEHATDGSTVALCEALRESIPLLNTVVLAHEPTLESAMSTMRAGAYDYLRLPQPVDALALALDRALKNRSLQREVRRLRRALNPGLGFQGILGDSAAMRDIFELMQRVAPARAPILITGETGTGKELVARGLHRAGPRAEGPFVAVNCAALPEALLESELFGHVKGAFTDARRGSRGLFVKANGGTLFLDEIGDLPLPLQAKLLRALQSRTVRPVGGEQEIPFDARLITATNRDLDSMVEGGTFRQDLYYRIHVIHIELPPLRARAGDILLLAQHFLAQNAALADEPERAISQDAARRLLEYPWPGNIRELENAIERGVTLATGPIEVEDLPNRVRGWAPNHVLGAAADPEELVTLKTMEERYLRHVLAATGGNRTRAARVLGIDRKSLYRKLQRLGLALESRN